jgi:hypothetical protein
MFASGSIDPVKLVQMVTAIANDMQGMVKDCTNAQDVMDACADEYIELFHVANGTLCRTDLDTLWGHWEVCLQDIQGSNFVKLLTDVMTLVQDGQQVKNTCAPAALYLEDACEETAKDMMDQVFDVVDMLIKGDIDAAKLLEDAEKAYQDFQNLANCSNIEDFVDAAAEEFVERVKVNNATLCVSDVDGLYTDVMAVVTDFKDGNETKLLLDLTKLLSALTQAKTDCTPSKIGLADTCEASAKDMMD